MKTKHLDVERKSVLQIVIMAPMKQVRASRSTLCTAY